MEKENKPPGQEPTREDLFKSCSVPSTPTTTPVLCNPDVESNSREQDLDTRDLEMSKKVRRSYSRLETLGCASTSTPGRRSCFGFEGLLGAEDLAGVSPLVCSKLTEVPKVSANPWAPDTTLPGISPPVVKEKRKKKKAPEILVSDDGQGLASVLRRLWAGARLWLFPGGRQHLQGVGRRAPANMPLSPLTCTPFLFPQKSELDEWAAAMNAEFEAAEQFDLLVE